MTYRKRMWTWEEIREATKDNLSWLTLAFIAFTVISCASLWTIVLPLMAAEPTPTTTQILEEAGWEKVCIKWEAYNNLCEIEDSYGRKLAEIKNISSDDCTKLMDIIPESTYGYWTSSYNQQCTRYTWLPPEEALEA